MNWTTKSLGVGLVASFLGLPTTSEADCAPPATSLLIEAEVVSCSTAEPLIREKVDKLFEMKRKYRAREAARRGKTPEPFDQAEIEGEVQARLKTGDVIAGLVIRRSRRFTEGPKLKAQGAWQTNEDRSPVKYLVRIDFGGCGELGEGKRLVVFAPFQCCDVFPGANDCLLGLPLAVDVPEELLEHTRSGG